MKPTLLLDLDDTLLNTNISQFIPVYFQKLAQHLSPRIDSTALIKELMSATQRMYASAELDQTLEEVFNQHFYAALNIKRADFKDEIEDFYDRVFPTIQPITSPLNGAVEFVEWAFAQGWQVAIATDPLFPRKAILERLRWANLPPEKYPFALIPDFETYHFAKESIAYYPEFLTRMGWVEGPILMIGDSLQRDILPAQKAGLPAFWFTESHLPAEEAPHIPYGGFDALKGWLTQAAETDLQADFNTESAILANMQAFPAVLDTWTRNLPDSTWQNRPSVKEWALCELVCHLRDVDIEVSLPRLEMIAGEENVFVEGFVTDEWVEARGYIQQDGRQAFQTFLQARKQLINKVQQFTAKDWSKKIRHSILGPMTVKELMAFVVEHDRTHIQQASQIIFGNKTV